MRGDLPNAFLDAVKAGCRSKVVFHLNEPADLQVTADMLFRDRMDVDERKHVLETTKVLGYRDEIRTSVSRGETRVASTASGRATSEMQGNSETEGLSDGLTLSQAAYPAEEGGLFGLLPATRQRIRHDNVGELADDQFEMTAQVNASRGRNRATARSRAQGVSESAIEGQAYGESYSETQTPTLIPELGKEVSSVTFRSLEEQRHRAMTSIQALKTRMAWVRLIDSDEPRLLRTPTIKPAFLGNERETKAALAGFASDALQKLPFAIRKEALNRREEAPAGAEEPVVFSVPAPPGSAPSETEAGVPKPRARRRVPPAAPQS